MTTHRHFWHVVSKDALARYNKQDGQRDSVVYVMGRVEKCRCRRWRIVPHEKGLYTVEVEPIETMDLERMKATA